MTQMLRFAAHRATRILIGGSIAACAYLLALMFGPALEARLFPVVKFNEFIQYRDGSSLRVDTAFTKVRGCEYVGSQWYGETAAGEAVDIPVQYNNGSPMTRPVGANRDTNWVLDLPNPRLQSVFMLLHYRCGMPWLSYTIVGPYKLAK